MQYKGYLIEPFETSPGRWRARFRRLDGKTFGRHTDDNKFEQMDTVGIGMDRLSVQDAVEQAKEMIDGLI
jgi:hypothetical protein